MERPVRYVRDGFFYDRRFESDEGLNEQAGRRLEGTANQRQHGTTGERPTDRFERDQRSALKPRRTSPIRTSGCRLRRLPNGGPWRPWTCSAGR